MIETETWLLEILILELILYKIVRLTIFVEDYKFGDWEEKIIQWLQTGVDLQR